MAVNYSTVEIITVISIATMFSLSSSLNPLVEDIHAIPETSTSSINDTAIKSNNNTEKIAIITFDDGWKSQYEIAKPILDKYNFKATFYLTCDDVGKEGRLSWQEIKQLQNEGHEIGSHTVNHVNLDEIPSDEQEYEIVESKKCLENQGIAVHSFAYPFNSGDENNDVLDVVSKHYKFARTAGEIDNSSTANYQKYTILGESFSSESEESGDSHLQMLDIFKNYVNKQQNNATIYDEPILIYHQIDNEESHTSPDLFSAEMEYLYKNNFKVVTMNKIYS